MKPREKPRAGEDVDFEFTRSRPSGAGPDIIVTGWRYPVDSGGVGGGGGLGGTGRGDPGLITDRDTFDELDEQPTGHYETYVEIDDRSQVVVNNLVNRPLTPAEQEAFDDFVKGVLDNVDDIATANALLKGRVFGGLEVSMHEIQDLWRMVDFEIVDNNHNFGNGTARGSASWNNGNPVISFSLGQLERADSFDNSVGSDAAIRFQSLHDVAHLTAVGRHYPAPADNNWNGSDVEKVANEIAKGL